MAKTQKQTRTGEPYIRLHKRRWHLFYRNPDPSKNYPVHKSLRLKAEREADARRIEAEAKLVWKECEPEFDLKPARIKLVMERFIRDKIQGQKRGGREQIKSKYLDKSLGQVLDEFLKSKQGKAHRTRQHYRTHINHIKRLMDCSMPVSQVTPGNIQNLLQARVEEDKVHKKTANKLLGSLKSIFNFAQKHDYITKNPAQMVERYSLEPADKDMLREPVYIPREIYEAMLHSRAARRYPPIRQVLFLLYHTGMRVGELCRLKWADIDLENHIIHVTASPQKGGDRDPYMVSRQLRVYMAISKKMAHQSYDRGRWKTNRPFEQIPVVCNGNGNKLGYSNLFHRVWRPFLQELVQEKDDVFRDIRKTVVNHKNNHTPVSFHDFRHTFITDLLTQGINPIVVGWLVGHKELHTQRRYTHLCYNHFTEEFKNYKR